MAKLTLKLSTIVHFPVTFFLCFKMSPRAKPFMRKWVWKWKWTWRENTSIFILSINGFARNGFSFLKQTKVKSLMVFTKQTQKSLQAYSCPVFKSFYTSILHPLYTTNSSVFELRTCMKTIKNWRQWTLMYHSVPSFPQCRCYHFLVRGQSPFLALQITAGKWTSLAVHQP